VSRKSIDCRKYDISSNCSVIISGTEEEVLDLAVLHGIVAHGHDDPYRLRQELRNHLQDAPLTSTALA
jgi:Protein of unknown function (DUF1059)